MNREPWILLSDVPDIVYREIGHRPTRQTVYNWVRRGWLKVENHRPMRTTMTWIMSFLDKNRGTTLDVG